MRNIRHVIQEATDECESSFQFLRLRKLKALAPIGTIFSARQSRGHHLQPEPSLPCGRKERPRHMWVCFGVFGAHISEAEATSLPRPATQGGHPPEALWFFKFLLPNGSPTKAIKKAKDFILFIEKASKFVKILKR